MKIRKKQKSWRITLGVMMLVALVISCMRMKDAAPQPIGPVPTPAQLDWHKMETYAFFHFSMNTFTDREWGYGDTPAAKFNPTSSVDCDQWVALCKNAGMTGVILTAKHHDGFCLWPSQYTEYSVKNSPWKDGKGDLVKELSDACKKHGLKLGLYLSPWDRNHPQYGKEEYVAYFHQQIDELISNYGDLFEYWFDGANGGDGYYGGARETRSIDPNSYYQYERAVDRIKEKHPNVMIFGGTKPDIRWVGNESGWAGQTSWSTINTAEVKDDYVKLLSEGSRDGALWLPSECDVSIRPGWFYHTSQDDKVKSVEKLVDLYYESVGRNANFLLNLTPAPNGRILPLDSLRLMEYYRTITLQLQHNLLAEAPVKASDTRRGYGAKAVADGDYDSYWATPDGVHTGVLTIDLPGDSVWVNRLLLQEYIPLGQRVEKFEVEIGNGGSFVPVDIAENTTTIGYKRILRFAKVAGDQIRIHFTASRGELCINNIEAFNAPDIITRPKLVRDANDFVSMVSVPGTAIYYTMDGSDPTTESLHYTVPFVVSDKVLIKAIAVDQERLDNISAVALLLCDIPRSSLNVVGDEGNRQAFDGNVNTLYEASSPSVVFDLGGLRNINKVLYQPRKDTKSIGTISDYAIAVSNDGVRYRRVASGQFGNVLNNPQLQEIVFSPARCRYVKIEAHRLVKGSRPVFAEIDFITTD